MIIHISSCLHPLLLPVTQQAEGLYLLTLLFTKKASSNLLHPLAWTQARVKNENLGMTSKMILKLVDAHIQMQNVHMKRTWWQGFFG